jgi:hypothetical protein
MLKPFESFWFFSLVWALLIIEDFFFFAYLDYFSVILTPASITLHILVRVIFLKRDSLNSIGTTMDILELWKDD